MNTRSVIAGVAAACVFISFGVWLGETMDPSKAGPKSPPAGSSIPTTCSGSDDVSDVVQFHIGSDDTPASGPLTKIDAGALTCSNCIHIGSPFVGGMSPTQDDNGSEGITVAARPQAPNQSAEWYTPFDVDLAAIPWKVNAATKAVKPILIKISLDDARLHFFTARDNNHPDQIGPPNAYARASDWAVRAGQENPNMFDCRSPITLRGDTTVSNQPAPHDFLTVWAHQLTAKSGSPVFGGLNIGLIFKEQVSTFPGANGTTVSTQTFMPIYIDPIYHNNG
jgi:hypothetical protein